MIQVSAVNSAGQGESFNKTVSIGMYIKERDESERVPCCAVHLEHHSSNIVLLYFNHFPKRNFCFFSFFF